MQLLIKKEDSPEDKISCVDGRWCDVRFRGGLGMTKRNCDIYRGSRFAAVFSTTIDAGFGEISLRPGAENPYNIARVSS